MNLSKTPSAKPGAAASREERLAQRLRENLRRRKAQARALSDAQEEMAPPPGGNAPESA
ncbi:hypothetical protein [Novosphingobium pokkalii]|uniref:Uncharacterized protein n=1 Tax=Novosphingobium pokkalii TaxID=1770194 RepID=A0ABV7V000_9SPHN|nr:hypothetical protein [Novosphingobium pokkalii]GHC84318.1 hypothetical protein GCM10019060_04040 [Novosphingobium pokkalii]